MRAICLSAVWLFTALGTAELSAVDKESLRDPVLQAYAAASAAAPLPERITRETLLQRPARTLVRLAPDGRALLSIRRSEDAGAAESLLEVWTLGPQADLQAESLKTLARFRGPISAEWSRDDTGLWVVDEQGLMWWPRSGAVLRRIYTWQEKSAGPGRAKRERILGEQAGGMLIEARDSDEPAAIREIWRLLPDGRRLPVLSAPGLRAVRLRADGSLAFSAGFVGEHFDSVVRWHDKQPGALGQEIVRCALPRECAMQRSDSNGEELWLLGQPKGSALQLLHWRRGKGWLAATGEARGDVEQVIWGEGDAPLAFATDEGERSWHALNGAAQKGGGAEVAKTLVKLQDLLPETNLHLSTSADAQLWLVRAESAQHPADRYALFRPATGQLRPLFPEDHQTASGLAFRPMQAFQYRASDGLSIPAYLLLPAGRPAKSLPLIAWLHGGPVAREHRDFDARMQLLANRGVAVLVVNFRGSSGFGLDYTLAAAGDVGKGRVLQDVLDGLDYLLAQGIGDAGKQALFGHSFGGYLALTAASHAPERFSAVWAAAPPTDYGWMKQWQIDHDTPAIRGDGAPLRLMFPAHGFAVADPAWRQKMAAESPRENVAALKAPVFLWAGRMDRNVPQSSMTDYVARLRQHGKPVSLLMDESAAHSPGSARSSEAYLFWLEAAAHRTFGTTLEPASPALRAFLQKQLQVDTAGLLAN